MANFKAHTTSFKINPISTLKFINYSDIDDTKIIHFQLAMHYLLHPLTKLLSKFPKEFQKNIYIYLLYKIPFTSVPNKEIVYLWLILVSVYEKIVL